MRTVTADHNWQSAGTGTMNISVRDGSIYWATGTAAPATDDEARLLHGAKNGSDSDVGYGGAQEVFVKSLDGTPRTVRIIDQ